MRLIIIASLLLAGGCAQTARFDSMAALRSEMAAVSAALDVSNQELATLKAQELQSQDTVSTGLEAVQAQLAGLQKEMQKRYECPKQQADNNCPNTTQPTVVSEDGKVLLGEVERVWIDPPGMQMIARMDTGASSSSLHAQKVTPFERDGEDWVRFDLVEGDETASVERAVHKYVRVYQQADKKGSRRPVVLMRISVGNIQDTFEFTLADRSHLEHNMILGRNFLTDIALVDVSRQNVQPARNK